MNANDIYSDIAKRTNGDIYIGVVGPVRTGKSTFIKKFMETLVIPNIESDYRKERAIDELPQSAAGKTIMTTEPKFIPEEAVSVDLGDSAKFNVRMIDCVGYIIPSSVGYIENEMPRMVVTPWFEGEVPFNMAAEVGTQKVIIEHSTIGLVVTTDGSISDIPREEYEECEERVINELQAIDKPFVVLMNSANPENDETKAMCKGLQEKYATPVIPVNCLTLTVGEKLLIKPSWENCNDTAGRKILEIDPASSFGTGQHNTTQLCLELLEKYLKEEDKLLDLGCGSGILSIGGVLLGAKSVVAVDIAENAVNTAIENAQKNNISKDVYNAYCGNITEDENLVNKIGSGYNVICANIVADVLIGMSSIFSKFLVPKGVLIMSGIINSRKDEVISAVIEKGFEVVEMREKDDWVAVALILND